MAPIQLISVPSLEYTKDPARIAAAMASDNYTRSRLRSNDNLTEADIRSLAQDDNESTRGSIAKRSDVPDDLLAQLAKDPSVDVKARALANPKMDAGIFAAAVLGQKFHGTALLHLTGSIHVATKLELFEALWAKSKQTHWWLVRRFDDAVEYRRPSTDMRISALIDREIMGQTNDTREVYARSQSISSPSILDQMKDDRHRPVVNAVAGNPRAWVSTHEHLVTSHKSPSIRISVAGATTDNDLLNSIYRSTKSEQIRKAVEKNPAFVPTAG